MKNEIRGECHICAAPVESSQLIDCMQCGFVMCKECHLDHVEYCHAVVIVMKTNLSEQQVAELRALIRANPQPITISEMGMAV